MNVRPALKKLLLASLTLGLLSIVVACSGTEIAGGSKPTATWDEVVKTRVAKLNQSASRTPIPTSTPFARRTPTIVATAGPTPTPTATFTPEPTPTPNPLSAALAPVLLTVDDLPIGWKVSQQELEVELTRTDNICGVEVSDPAVVDLIASYEAGLAGPFASEALSLYDDGGNAAAVFSQLTDAYAACPETGYDYPDGSWSVVAPISFPTIGDESLSLRMTMGAGEFAIEADLIIFRVDEVLAIVSYADFSGLLGSPGNPSQLENLARSAEAKIHAHADHIDSIEVPSQTI